jgi:hypothetical protein
MELHHLELTSVEYEKLNSKYPESEGSGLIGKRAEEIVKIYFRKGDPQCQFPNPPPKGADLHVVFSGDAPSILIEVKGTKSAGLAWQQLKVSSQHSWRLLAEERIPVYRVSEVFQRSPSIYVLVHGLDFVLDEEPRWTFKRIQPRNEDHAPPPPATEDDSVTQAILEGARRSKYDALREHLKSERTPEVTFHFKDAARVLGFSLPSSAHKYQAFWANQSDTTNRPWARAWQEAGYEVDSYRLSGLDGWVRFKRRAS